MNGQSLLASLYQTLNQILAMQYLTTFILILGSIQIIIFLINLITLLNRQLIRPLFQSSTFLYDKYGKSTSRSNIGQSKASWAVVTGGSDGIGLEICHKLAYQGFNICIVARNQTKIDEKLQEIKTKNGVLTKCVIADFAELKTFDEYQNLIQSSLSDIDVALVILNAGAALMGPFIDITGKEVERIVNVNSLQVIYMAKAICSQLVSRHQNLKLKSGLMVVSSGLGARAISGSTAYSAAKSFSSFIAEALNTEFEGQIDIMSYQAGEVTTKMLNRFTTDYRTISAKRAADTSLRDLGYQQITYGSFRHELFINIFNQIPLVWMQKIMFNVSKTVLKKIRKRQEENKKTS